MDINKKKCKTLKKIRKALADKIGVELYQTECTFDGECRGTCPKCKQEESVLNKALMKKGIAIAAAAGAATVITGCARIDIPFNDISGMMEIPKETEKQICETEDFQLTGEVALPETEEILSSESERFELMGDVAPEYIEEPEQEKNEDNTILFGKTNDGK